jgi:hypothetical protein
MKVNEDGMNVSATYIYAQRTGVVPLADAWRNASNEGAFVEARKGALS